MTKYLYDGMEYEKYGDAVNDCIDDNYDDFIESAFSEVGYLNIMNALADTCGERVYCSILDLVYSYADEYVSEVEEEDEEEDE